MADLTILFLYVPTQMEYLRAQLEWRMGEGMCRLVYIVLPVALLTSIITLVAITADRARGISQPLKYRTDSSRFAKVPL